VTAGQSYVEGWRYQNPGPDSPSAAPPSVTPAVAFAEACGLATWVPASGGGGAGSTGGGAGGGAPGSGGSVSTSAPPASPATPHAGPAAGAAAPTTGAPHAAPGATTTTSRGTAGPNQRHAGGSTSTSAPSTSRAPQSKSKTKPTKLAASNAAAHRGSGGDTALPIVLVAVLIGLLGGAAWLRWRRKPAEE
jgi:hypothetical protein